MVALIEKIPSTFLIYILTPALTSCWCDLHICEKSILCDSSNGIYSTFVFLIVKAKNPSQWMAMKTQRSWRHLDSVTRFFFKWFYFYCFINTTPVVLKVSVGWILNITWVFLMKVVDANKVLNTTCMFAITFQEITGKKHSIFALWPILKFSRTSQVF